MRRDQNRSTERRGRSRPAGPPAPGIPSRAVDFATRPSSRSMSWTRSGDVCTFLTMELVEGRLLSEVIKLYAPRHMPLPDAWRIIKRLSAGLAYLHSCNVVHGCLSPQNVMVYQAGRTFTRARFRRPREVARARRAHGEASSGGAASTPAYAGWEVLDGRPADPRDDIYSLACMAYELLTGSHPFRRDGKRIGCARSSSGA